MYKNSLETYHIVLCHEPKKPTVEGSIYLQMSDVPFNLDVERKGSINVLTEPRLR